MEFLNYAFILLILILLSVMFAIYLLISNSFKSSKKNSSSYRVGNANLKADITKRYKNNNCILDPFESKLLKSLLDCPNEKGLSVKEINTILNLNKLSKENQRQRRHLVIKEINLKLYLLTGVREAIIRISSEDDRRVKYYNFMPEAMELSLIRELTLSHS